MQEFVEEPGLADARISHEQRDRALAVAGPTLDLGERPELPFATRQGRQLALLRDLEPALAAQRAAHGVRANRLGLPLDLEITQILEDEPAVSEVLRLPTRDDLARLRDREQPGRQIGGVTDRRVVHAK